MNRVENYAPSSPFVVDPNGELYGGISKGPGGLRNQLSMQQRITNSFNGFPQQPPRLDQKPRGLSNVPSPMVLNGHNMKYSQGLSHQGFPTPPGILRNIPGKVKPRRPPSVLSQPRDNYMHSMFNKHLQSSEYQNYEQKTPGMQPMLRDTPEHPFFIPGGGPLRMPHHPSMIQNSENSDNIGIRSRNFRVEEEEFGYGDLLSPVGRERPSKAKIGVQTKNSFLAVMKPIPLKTQLPSSVRVYGNDNLSRKSSEVNSRPQSRSYKDPYRPYGQPAFSYPPSVASRWSKKRPERKITKQRKQQCYKTISREEFNQRRRPLPGRCSTCGSGMSRNEEMEEEHKWESASVSNSERFLYNEPKRENVWSRLSRTSSYRKEPTMIGSGSKFRNVNQGGKEEKRSVERGRSKQRTRGPVEVPSRVLRNSHNMKFGSGRSHPTFQPPAGSQKNLPPGGKPKTKRPPTPAAELKEEDLYLMFNQQLQSEYQKALDKYNNYEQLNQGLIPEGTDKGNLNQFKSSNHTYFIPKANNFQMPAHHPTTATTTTMYQNPENPANPDNIGIRQRPKGLIGPSVKSIFAEQPQGAQFGYIDMRDRPSKAKIGVQTGKVSLAAMKSIPLRPGRPPSVRVFANDNQSMMSSELNSNLNSTLNSSMLTPPPTARRGEDQFVSLYSTLPPPITFKGSKKKRKEKKTRRRHRSKPGSKEETRQSKTRPASGITYDIPIVPPPPMSAVSIEYTDSLIAKLRRNILSVFDESKTILMKSSSSSILSHVIKPPPEDNAEFVLPPIAAPPPREIFSLPPSLNENRSGLKEQFPYQLAVHEMKKAEASKEIEKNSQSSASKKSKDGWKFGYFLKDKKREGEEAHKEMKEFIKNEVKERCKIPMTGKGEEALTEETKESEINVGPQGEGAKSRVSTWGSRASRVLKNETEMRSEAGSISTSDKVPFDESMRENVKKQLAGIFNKDQLKEVLYPVKLLTSGSLSVASDIRIPSPVETPPPSPLSADSSKASLEGQVSDSILHLPGFPGCDCPLCHRDQMGSKDSFIDKVPYVQPNYIEINRKRLKSMKKAISNKTSVVVIDPKGNKGTPMKKLLGTPGFGLVPQYIQKRKREFLKAKEGETKYELRKYMNNLLREISGDGGNSNYLDQRNNNNPPKDQNNNNQDLEYFDPYEIEKRGRDEFDAHLNEVMLRMRKLNSKEPNRPIFLSTKEFSRMMRDTSYLEHSGSEVESKTSGFTESEAEHRFRKRNP